MASLPWKPLRLLTDLNRQIEEAFADVIHQPWGREEESASWQPAIDVYETDDAYHVEADLPGVTPEDLQVRIQGQWITICGTRRSLKRIEQGRTVRIERAHGRFCRSFRLEHAIDPSKIETTYENGIYQILIPKSQPSSTRK